MFMSFMVILCPFWSVRVQCPFVKLFRRNAHSWEFTLRYCCCSILGFLGKWLQLLHSFLVFFSSPLFVVIINVICCIVNINRTGCRLFLWILTFYVCCWMLLSFSSVIQIQSVMLSAHHRNDCHHQHLLDFHIQHYSNIYNITQ